MKKILHVSMGYTCFGGIEKMEMNYVTHIKGDYKNDILTPNDIPFKNYEQELKKYNCDVYNLHTSRKTLIDRLKYNYRLSKFLKKNKYDIIHIHSAVFLFSYKVAKIAKHTRYKENNSTQPWLQ